MAPRGSKTSEGGVVTAAPVAREEGGLGALTEDTLGFGASELRTARDLLLRPGVVLDAYDQGGSTGGGRYTRSLRFYLLLNGLMLLITFLVGGTEAMFARLDEDHLRRWAAGAGKSLDAFLADADGWSSLLTTPVYALFSTATIVPLIALWTRSGWRRSFRAGFAYLSAWTLPLVVVTPFAFSGRFAGLAFTLTAAVAVITLLRVGSGRWWRTWKGGIAKTIVFTIVLLVMTLVSAAVAFALSVLGARFGP